MPVIGGTKSGYHAGTTTQRLIYPESLNPKKMW